MAQDRVTREFPPKPGEPGIFVCPNPRCPGGRAVYDETTDTLTCLTPASTENPAGREIVVGCGLEIGGYFGGPGKTRRAGTGRLLTKRPSGDKKSE